MKPSTAFTIVLSLLAASSLWTTIMIPIGIDDPTASRAEHKAVEDIFLKRRLYFALVTALTLAAAIMCKSNTNVTIGLAGTATFLVVLYAIVLNKVWIVNEKYN